MFETSVVRAQARAVRGRAGLLTVSLAAHSAIIVGAIALSVASVEFPAAAPDEFAHAPELMPLRIPPPLGNPNGGAPPRQPQAQPQRPAPEPPPSQQTAPALIPETITPAETTGSGEITSTAIGGTEPGPVGVPWGEPNSIGDPDAPPATGIPAQTEPEEKIYQPHEVKAPVLIRKVEPRFPELWRRIGKSATVVVRCVIDKNGNVRDPQVIVPGPPQFNAAVIDAVEQWRYKPATHGGRPVDSYLDLTVTFNVVR